MKRNPKRERWFAMFEETLVRLAPQFAGRINWDAATFLFNRGDSPGFAAVKFIETETPQEKR